MHARKLIAAVSAAIAASVSVLAGTGAAQSTGASARSGPARPALSGSLALPDLRIFVPVNLISIGISPDTGHRELRFTHITADVGAGPFEIDPHYDASTGISTFTQALYRSTAAGGWTYDHSVPVAADGVWHPPSDYAFPLTRFVLDRLGSNGSPGATVAVSPKTDYCMTGDTQLSGIPNTPDQTFIPESNCTDPTRPLGWSVGWGDEYDQTDAGQPIDLTGVPDGTYLLRATVDPRHVLTESNTANDVTDTALRIAGNGVTVLSQSLPGVALPEVELRSPRAGERLSGTVRLSAAASAPSGQHIRSVQFVVDGQPIGRPLRAGTYTMLWNTRQARPGRHELSARVLDGDGTMNSARPVEVMILQAAPIHVLLARWRRGRLILHVRSRRGSGVAATLLTAGHRRRRRLSGGWLRARIPRPARITLELVRRGKPASSPLSFTLAARPALHISSPVAHLTLSGIVPVSVSVSDPLGADHVSFMVDGRRIGHPVTRPPYVVHLDTRRLRTGYHRLQVRARNALGHVTTATLRVRVANPAPPMTCSVMQARATGFGSGAASIGPLHTIIRGETLLALVSADGPAASRQTARVEGGGLQWHLAARANGSAGDSEVWSADARRPAHLSRISATAGVPGYSVNLAVVAMEGADGVGAAASASAPSGAPRLHLRTLSRTSLVFAAGNDWDRAAARTLSVGWQMLDQRLDIQTGDTFWSQYTNQPTGRAGSRITVSDLRPTSDRWNLAAVELINSGD